VTIVSVVTGLGLGAVGGFVAIASFIVTNPISLFGSLFGGGVISIAVVVTIACFERVGLRLRGYRRLSRSEVRRIAWLVKEVSYVLNLPALPRFAMEDSVVPNAWTHMRTIVMTTGLLETLTDEELRAVLAHELEHWRKGDAVGLRFVWAASLPAVLLFNLGTLISGRWPSKEGEAPPRTPAGGLLALIGWFIAWPAWVLTKWVVVPLTAKHQRQYEYEADAAVREAGFGVDLASALTKLSAFEGGRTGWERAMTATHPPTALRIDALQPLQADDWDYQEDELRGPTWKEIRRLVIGQKLPKSIIVQRTPTP
jgi:Zn-dependent protease with chaperone function